MILTYNPSQWCHYVTLNMHRNTRDQALSLLTNQKPGPDPVRSLDARRIFRRPVAVKEDREGAYDGMWWIGLGV